MMKRHDIPSLSAVRVFEAVARHLSFTRAAAELGMTQAAASYQVKLLEDRLGQPLFLRRARQIELTETGRLLAPAVTDAFQRLSSAFASAGGTAAGVLSMKVHVTFAAQWLMQRIGSFQIANPALAVRLDTSLAPSDFLREEIDLAIRFGTGDWPGLVVHRLVAGCFTPMLSPKLLDAMGGLSGPADLLRYKLFDENDPWWPLWFRTAGVERPLARAAASSFGPQFLEGRAVVAGHGVGILCPAFFQEELATGRLVQPFDILGRDDADYCLVYPENRRNVPKIRLFRDWILGEVTPPDQPPASFRS